MTTTRVLMYHGFGIQPVEPDPYNLFVTAGALDNHLALLRRARARAVGLDEYLATGGRGAGRTVLVTIDDGYRSVLELAAPRLAAAGVPAVLYVPPGRIGATSGWMPDLPQQPLCTAGELRELQAMGIELGVHGWDHTVMPGMSDAELKRHTVDARAALADLAGVVPRTFAYPEGRFDPRALAAVARAGFELAFSVHDDAGRLGVPRLPVTAVDTPATFALKLVPGYRSAWRAAGHLGGVRPVVRRVLSR